VQQWQKGWLGKDWARPGFDSKNILHIYFYFLNLNFNDFNMPDAIRNVDSVEYMVSWMQGFSWVKVSSGRRPGDFFRRESSCGRISPVLSITFIV